MLRLRLEMVPHGQEVGRFHLVTLEIINTLDHPQRPRYGNYRVHVIDDTGKIVRRIRVKNHERVLGYWPLIKRIAGHIGDNLVWDGMRVDTKGDETP